MPLVIVATLMKKKILTLCIVIIISLSLFVATLTAAGQSANDIRIIPWCRHPPCPSPPARFSCMTADEVLVRFTPDARKDGNVVPSIAADVNSKVRATVIEEFKGVPGLQLVKLSEGVTVPDAIAQYKQNPNVLYAEPNYLRYKSAIPNNRDFDLQWGLQNWGQTVRGVAGTPGADIDAVDAWNKTTGSNDVIVAVLDTGVNYNAPGLKSNMMPGWDFVTNSSDPMDRDGHGTKVAGIIAAVGNNGIGIAGVMWKAKIMPLRFIGSNGGFISDEIEAINYANSHGAHIINMSYGSSKYSQAEKDAIDASSALCVCSAGNRGTNEDETHLHYPADYSNSSNNIISVTATDQNDALASFSDYGPNSVQVAAPGVNIYSTALPFTVFWTDYFDNLTQWDAQAPWGITKNASVSEEPFAMVTSPGSSIINSSITLKYPLDLKGKYATVLGYRVWLNTEKQHDLFYVQASKDDIHWSTVDGWWGHSNQWKLIQVDLSDYDNSPYVKIRFGLSTDGKAGPSSVLLNFVGISTFNSSSVQMNYDSMSNGTSFSAAYVSGVAGLAKAANPSLTSLQIRDAILKNVDVKSSLSGKISTGGRINASKTLCAITDRGPLRFIPNHQLMPNFLQYRTAYGQRKNLHDFDAYFTSYSKNYKN